MARSTHDPAYRYLVNKLRLARQEAGLTQQQVADAIDGTQVLISKIEAGERRIDPLELARLAKLYRKPLDHFLEVPEDALDSTPVEITVSLPKTDLDELTRRAEQHGAKTSDLVAEAVSEYLSRKVGR